MSKNDKIVMMPIDSITPYYNNPRKHDSISEVKESIRRVGFRGSIWLDRNNVIIAGHGRYMAAKELGMKEVPVTVMDDLTEAEVKYLRIKDNRASEQSTWDDDAYLKELDELREMDFDVGDIEMDVGTIDLGDEEPVQVEEDDFDEEQDVNEHGVKKGDVWQLGDHRLMCGSSADKDSMLILMAGGGEKASCVFTDPPYGVAIGDKNKALDTFQKAERITQNIEGDTMTKDELYTMLTAAMTNIRESCHDDACYYVTSPQGGSLGLMMMMMRDAGLPVRHVLMWKKNAPTFSMGRLDYDYQHEPMFYTWTEKHNNRRRSEFRTSVWEVDKPRKCDLHPTMKPVELVAGCIEDSTDPGDIVLDGFGGSGTTLIACEQLGRKARLMEIDPHYCDVIISRWEKLTGETAVRIEG